MIIFSSIFSKERPVYVGKHGIKENTNFASDKISGERQKGLFVLLNRFERDKNHNILTPNRLDSLYLTPNSSNSAYFLIHRLFRDDFFGRKFFLASIFV